MIMRRYRLISLSRPLQQTQMISTLPHSRLNGLQAILLISLFLSPSMITTAWTMTELSRLLFAHRPCWKSSRVKRSWLACLNRLWSPFLMMIRIKKRKRAFLPGWKISRKLIALWRKVSIISAQNCCVEVKMLLRKKVALMLVKRADELLYADAAEACLTMQLATVSRILPLYETFYRH